MKITPLAIQDVVLIEPLVFEDNRGFFFESFNQKMFHDRINSSVNFVQDNHSKSSSNVLRGLHYQLPPKTQGKLVRVISGSILDIAVDIRKNSSTFGHWVGEILSAENKKQLWIPEGFAHGFLTLSTTAELLYKTTNYYDSTLERCIHWSDEAIGIDWKMSSPPLVSSKDEKGLSLCDADVFEWNSCKAENSRLE